MFYPAAAKEIGLIVAEDFIRPATEGSESHPRRGAGESAAGHQYRLSHNAAAGDRAAALLLKLPTLPEELEVPVPLADTSFFATSKPT